MCGRYTMVASGEELAKLFLLGATPALELEPRYNIAPTQDVVIVRESRSEARRVARAVRWGLVPSWAKDESIGNRMINARVETAAEKPSFRAAFKRRRCLIPATGFYEWRKLAKGKQPYLLGLADGGLFAMAGLWERWTTPDDSLLDSCAILTTAANELVGTVHHRMPVILPAAVWERWLDPELEDKAAVGALVEPFPSSEMRAVPLSRRVNNPTFDDPSVLERAEAET